MSAGLLVALVLAQAQPQHLPPSATGRGLAFELAYERTYSIHVLEPMEVMRLARASCRDAPDPGRTCSFSFAAEDFVLRADSPTHARFAGLLASHDLESRLQAFDLLLLSAGPAGSGHGDDGSGLPPEARAVIAELSELLAFGEFHLLGRGRLKAAREGSATIETAVGAYQVSLRFERDEEPDEPIRVERFELIHKPKSGKQRVVLSNALSLAPGETVVVGTSKPGPADRAVAVLVTAVKPAVAADVAARLPRAGKEVTSPPVSRREN